MRIGYPCINRSIGCTANSTFRLRNYSEERLIETVAYNLSCLELILRFNQQNSLLFFRISSDLIPFASHPVCTVDWAGLFREEFTSLGRLIRKNTMRISMHPDQFVLLNAPSSDIVTSSIRELEYHATVLDSLSLDTSAKIQIHAGGVYDDKRAGMRRFAESFRRLDSRVRRRLVVENDDMRYTLSECLALHEMTGAPVLLDTFHHEVNCSGEGLGEALRRAGATWSRTDGPLMIDYSSQEPGHKRGTHVREIDSKNFRRFLRESSPYDFDIMLEIKDKERSALAAVAMAAGDPRFVG